MKHAALILFFLVGCASHTHAGWGDRLDTWDGKPIELSGMPVFSDIDPSFLYLCPPDHSGAADGGCIDVAAPAGVVTRLRRTGADCATVIGTFSAFGQTRVGTGFLRSNIGLIDAKRATPCVRR